MIDAEKLKRLLLEDSLLFVNSVNELIRYTWTRKFTMEESKIENEVFECYDNLIAEIKHRFSGKKGEIPKNDYVDAVGYCIGIERIFAILENNMKKKNTVKKTSDTLVYVASAMKDLSNMSERIKLVTELWSSGIPAELSYESVPKPAKQTERANDIGVKLMVWIGSSELKNNTVTIKDMSSGTQMTIARSGLIEQIKKLLS